MKCLTQQQPTSRRGMLTTAGFAGFSSLVADNVVRADETPRNTFRIGMISASIQGKSPPRHGHNWHFGQYLPLTCDLDPLKKHDPSTRAVLSLVYDQGRQCPTNERRRRMGRSWKRQTDSLTPGLRCIRRLP